MNGFDADPKNILTHHMERIHISNIDKTDITIIKTSEIAVMMDYKREYFDQFV